MERFSFVFLVAGLGFFVLAFIVSAWLPWLPFSDLEVESVEELAADPPVEFLLLKEEYPEAYEKAFGGMTDEEAFAEALVVGRKIYIGEACWHCHSQQVRPVGGDEARFGRVSYPEEYNNDLNYPPLWGTRRVGPDLIRESGRQSNDWHVAHFWNPRDVSPLSVMPRYTWFFEDDDPATEVNESLQPNRKGLAIIAYVQWLGSWENSVDEVIQKVDIIERQFDSPKDDIHPRPSPEPAENGDKAPAKDGKTNGDGYDDYGNGGGKDQPDDYGDDYGDSY